MVRTFTPALLPGALLTLLVMSVYITPVFAQQARGVFFTVNGPDSAPSQGDPDFFQAIYLDIPLNENRDVYVRIFDADVGGYLDNRTGIFNTRTRFLIVGGVSASRIYGASPESGITTIAALNIDSGDIIRDQTFGADPQYDGRYFNFGSLPVDRGFRTTDGFARFVLIAYGLEGDDANYFNFVLSYDPNDKVQPEGVRMFTYALTLRAPDFPNFQGHIRIPVKNTESVFFHTFGLAASRASVSVPFYDDVALPSSPANSWLRTRFNIPNPAYTSEIGFNFFGSGSNNTFSMLITDQENNPVPLPLPIPDYEPDSDPRVLYETSYPDTDCNVVQFKKTLVNGSNFTDVKTAWVIDGDTLSGTEITNRFDQPGYTPFDLIVSGTYKGTIRTVLYSDSVFINRPPFAWAGANRSFVAGRSMAFDGTVSEDYDGKITRYLWDFGDGSVGQGARIDHVYERPGTYTVTLTVIDNSNTPCNSATASVQVTINQPPIARISAPASTQVGDVIMLDGSGSSDSDGDIIDYSWTINDTTRLSGQIVEYRVLDDAPVRVRLEVTDNANTLNSKASATQRVRVNKIPIARAGADKHVSPSRPATFNASLSEDPDGRIVSYEWTFPNDTRVSGPVVQQGIDEPGWHTVYLRVTDNEGATGIDSMTVRVNFPPVPVITGNRVSNDGRVALSAANSYDEDGDGRIISFEWITGDGRRIIGEDFNHTYRKPGRYAASLTIIDNSGTFSSVQTDRFSIHVNQLPVARSIVPETGAPGQLLTFNAERSSDPDGSITAYHWNFGDGNTAEGVRVTHQYTKPGLYQVQLKVTDDSGHPESVAYNYTELNIRHAPVIVANYPRRAARGSTFTVDLTESFDRNAGVTIRNFLWFENGRWQPGEAVRSFNMGSEEFKSIRFAVDNGLNLPNSRSESEALIRINRAPVVAELPETTSANRTIKLDAAASADPDGDVLTFDWDLGDGNRASGPVVVHTFDDGGVYTIKLTVNDQQGLPNSESVAYTTVRVNNAPQFTMTVPDLVCANEPFKLTANSSGNEPLQFYWYINDALIESGSEIEHVLQAAETYTIKAEANDMRNLPNSVSIATQNVRVIGKPVALADASRSVCERDAVLFDASASSLAGGEIVRYQWDFGDGNTGEGIRPVHRYASSGTYTVKLTVEGNTAANCRNTASYEFQITVYPEVIARFHIPDVVYEDENILLDPTPSLIEVPEIDHITWSLNDSEILSWSKDSDGIWLPSIMELAGDYNRSFPVASFPAPQSDGVLTLTTSVNAEYRCNAASTSTSFKIRPRPALRMRHAPVLAPFQSSMFSIDGADADIQVLQNATWDFGDGTTASGKAVIHQFQEPGLYTVQLVSASTSSAVTHSLVRETIRVNHAPIALIDAPTLHTLGAEIMMSGMRSFDSDGEITSWNWIFSDGQTFSGPEVRRTFTQAGEYTVTLVVTDNSGVSNNSASAASRIRVLEKSQFLSTLPEVLCKNNRINLADALGLSKTEFDEVAVVIENAPVTYQEALQYAFTEVGNKTIQLVLKDSTVQEQTVFIRSEPDISARVPETILLGGTSDAVLFDASGTSTSGEPALYFNWDFGDGTQKQGAAVWHTFRRPGNYTVTLTVTDNTTNLCNRANKEYRVRVIRE